MQQVARKFFIDQLTLSLLISPAADKLSFFIFSPIFPPFYSLSTPSLPCRRKSKNIANDRHELIFVIDVFGGPASGSVRLKKTPPPNWEQCRFQDPDAAISGLKRDGPVFFSSAPVKVAGDERTFNRCMG
jgi:hypothetical protein